MTDRIDPKSLLAHPGLGAVLAALPSARLVGGCVRDSLAHQPVWDIDLATPDAPDAVVKALEHAGLRAIPTGIAHGTVSALSDGQMFEITTLRRDVETDGRHAVVAFTDDWREDAARRDFTINAMSLSADGTVFDYFGGVADLRAGHVRFVGGAETRIAEDYLRILRYFRFFARYGKGEPDPNAVSAVAQGVPGLARLSGERVWSELQRILQAPAPDDAIALMARLGVLDAILPGAQTRPLHRLPADPVLRLAALWPKGPAPLKLSGNDAERLALLQGPSPPETIDDPELRRRLADTPPAILVDRARLAGRTAALCARIGAMAVPVFPVQGRDLAARGMAPGPQMGHALKRLRALWMEGGCIADRDTLLAQLAGEATP